MATAKTATTAEATKPTRRMFSSLWHGGTLGRKADYMTPRFRSKRHWASPTSATLSAPPGEYAAPADELSVTAPVVALWPRLVLPCLTVGSLDPWIEHLPLTRYLPWRFCEIRSVEIAAASIPALLT